MKAFDKEYKLMTVKRFKESGKPMAEVARELDLSPNTLHDWVRKFDKHGEEAFPGTGNLHSADEELRKLRREILDLKEENLILKKGGRLLREKPEIERFRFMQTHRSEFRVVKMAEVLKGSRNGFYAYLARPISDRQQQNKILLEKIKKIHQKSKATYGYPRMADDLKDQATGNSNHDLPVAENLLNREFTADKPIQKWASYITYIWTDEGWLYLAGIMDLCDRTIVGFSMASPMRNPLVISALKQAIGRTKACEGLLAHLDRGAQYAPAMPIKNCEKEWV